MKTPAHFLLFLISLAPAVSAQTSVSGTSHCGKPDPAYTVPVGDRPDHAYGIVKLKCIWVKPLRMDGAQMKADEVTGFSEVTGNRSADHSFVVGTLSTGDRVYVRSEGKSVLVGGVPQRSAGTWIYAGSTGKLKGIRGKGTYNCKASADGTSTCEVKGVYQLRR